MSQFGDVAVLAVDLFQRGEQEPREAWQKAAEQLLTSKEMQRKNCPRATFLVLCQEGLIIGIPAGEYVREQENREYTLNAVHHLAGNPSLLGDPRGLWKLVVGGDKPKHNEQMHVLTALWNKGLINKSPVQS